MTTLEALRGLAEALDRWPAAQRMAGEPKPNKT
jgi:hypothetical protein